MKYRFLLIVILFYGVNLYSQDQKFSLEASYPLTIDNNFIGDRSFGVIDLGIKYSVVNLEVLNIGLGVNGGVLVDNTNQANFPLDFKRTIYTIQPKVFGEFNLRNITKLHPFVNLGYSFVRISLSGANNGQNVSGFSETLGGVNVGLGVKYDLFSRVFLLAQYDFSKLDPGNAPDTSYNTNFSLLKIGVGLRF